MKTGLRAEIRPPVGWEKGRKAMDASASWAEIVTALAVMGIIAFLSLI